MTFLSGSSLKAATGTFIRKKRRCEEGGVTGDDCFYEGEYRISSPAKGVTWDVALSGKHHVSKFRAAKPKRAVNRDRLVRVAKSKSEFATHLTGAKCEGFRLGELELLQCGESAWVIQGDDLLVRAWGDDPTGAADFVAQLELDQMPAYILTLHQGNNWGYSILVRTKDGWVHYRAIRGHGYGC